MGAVNVGASREAIRHHYDAGNEFFALWLDETLVYSCALWRDNEDDTLEDAQRRKLDYLAALAGVRTGDRVLDVGCGWGAGLERLVTQHSAEEAVGLTLSDAQAASIRGRAIPGVEVRVESWADHAPEAPYNAIVSIGAFEHFARPGAPRREKLAGYRTFFERCHGWLSPGARLGLQTMAVGTGRLRAEDLRAIRFIGRELFPQSSLPRVSDVFAASDRLFEVVEVVNHREHYERTCLSWLANLRARRDDAVTLVGEEVTARYERYLELAASMFERRLVLLLRMALTTGGKR